MTAIFSKLIFPFFLLYLKVFRVSIWSLKLRLKLNSSPNRLLVALYDAYFAQYGSFVGFGAEVAGEPCFPHGPYGVFISHMAKIGKNAVIFQHVTIGSNTLMDAVHPGSPSIGNNAYIGAGSKIIGLVTIGDNCRIGANAVVYSDMAANSVAVQAHTRIIQKSNLDNRFVTYRNGKKVYYADGSWLSFDD